MAKWQSSDYVIFVGSIALIVLLLFIVVESKPATLVERSVRESSVATEFRPTYFEVYDKSTATVCDRLVRVAPFGWTVWAKSGRVYLLNDTNHDCPLNSTPAVVVPDRDDETKHTFTSVCIDMQLQSVLDGYRDTSPHKVPFEIEDLQAERGKFTILDVLNYLFTRYVTMDAPRTAAMVVDAINERPVNSVFRHTKVAPAPPLSAARVFTKKEKERLLAIMVAAARKLR